MSAVDASIVFLPRFTTLVGETEFTVPPLDVSQFSGAQFQVWRGPMRLASGVGTFKVYFEESLDTLTWVLGPNTPSPFTILEDEVRLFSYSFRLRWFRLRVEVTGTDPIVTTWAEGLLRGGGGGAWSQDRISGGSGQMASLAAAVTPPSVPLEGLQAGISDIHFAQRNANIAKLLGG